MVEYEKLVEVLGKIRERFTQDAEDGVRHEISKRDASLGNIRYLGGQRDGVAMSFDHMLVEINKIREE